MPGKTRRVRPRPPIEPGCFRTLMDFMKRFERQPLLIPFFVTVGLLATPLDAEWTILDHAHLQANYDAETDEWELGVNPGHGGTGLLAPDTTILLLDAATRMTVPELDSSWDFMGEQGDEVWATSEFGFAQYGVPTGVFTGGDDGRIEMTLAGYDSPDEFFMYRPGDSSSPLRFDTRLESGPYGSVELDAGGHRHYSWAFRARGIYLATIEASGVRESDGVETSSEPATFIFLVDPSPVDWWVLEHFGTEANQPSAALDADPGGEGVTNLQKYAFGLDPKAPCRDGLPSMEVRTEDEGEAYLWISYRRPEGREDVRYSVQVSADPSEWESIDESGARTEWSSDSDGTPVISVSDVSPLAPATSRFMRVRTEWSPYVED